MGLIAESELPIGVNECIFVFSLQVTLVMTLHTAGTNPAPALSATLYVCPKDGLICGSSPLGRGQNNYVRKKWCCFWGCISNEENFGSMLTSFLTYFHQLCPFHVCVWGRKRDIKEPSNSLLYTLMSASMVYQNDIASMHRRNRERESCDCDGRSAVGWAGLPHEWL